MTGGAATTATPAATHTSHRSGGSAATGRTPRAPDESTSARACACCLRRVWLLARCSPRLEYRARDLDRLWALLALPDEQLIEAIGGRKREEIRAGYRACRPDGAWLAPVGLAHAICRHDPSYPRQLREHRLASPALAVSGDPSRLAAALDEKVVAIVGTRRATDYGAQIAGSLARELAATGVTVASALAEGIPRAAHAGALEGASGRTGAIPRGSGDTNGADDARRGADTRGGGGASVSILAGGIDKPSPAHCRSLYLRLIRHGCAISELPAGFEARRWSALSRARTLALIANLVIVVEADANPWELACAQLALGLDTPVGAVPGRVSSPASRGTNMLLRSGAALVRDGQDALDLLYGVGVRHPPGYGDERDADRLDPRLLAILERVGAGEDTVEALTARRRAAGDDVVRARDDVLTALAELELRRLLARGDGGRYVPCAALASR